MKFFLSLLVLIFFRADFSQAKIRLHKVKEAPKTCSIMKEESLLSRPEKKILGTEKNSLIIDDQISLVSDLGQKQCVWPVEKFLALGDLKKISFYIDEYKNFLVAYGALAAASTIQQVQINIDRCQFNEIKTLTEVSLPKCEVPKKTKKIRRKKTV